MESTSIPSSSSFIEATETAAATSASITIASRQPQQADHHDTADDESEDEQFEVNEGEAFDDYEANVDYEADGRYDFDEDYEADYGHDEEYPKGYPDENEYQEDDFKNYSDWDSEDDEAEYSDSEDRREEAHSLRTQGQFRRR